MIDLTKHPETLKKNLATARARGIVVPTFAELRDPGLIPEDIKERLSQTGLWEVDPVNLFRITWKNEPREHGGLFGPPNFIELPGSLLGIKARVVAMVGKFFPTGCHKVGASFGCLVPRLVTGQFDAAAQRAVWPSTGNYCRGGVFNSKLLGVRGVAVLPQGMSRERFDWLESIGAEIITTPGSESNVKEIFDKTAELKRDPSCMVFNQFEEMGNHLWHYSVTGSAMAEAFELVKGKKGRLAGACFTTGSAGTIGAGDRLKELYPTAKLAVGEALQCPTLLRNGFGEHRIEGIGDKHVPWIHNVRNTDMVIDIDDNDCFRLNRLFAEPEGRAFLAREFDLEPRMLENLNLLGISGIANVLCCVKFAKYYELTPDDVVMTVLTDSASMYVSRVEELAAADGAYSQQAAALDYVRHIGDLKTDNMQELSYYDKKRIHNLKYYTWVEQQGRTVEELNALWDDPDGTWGAVHRQADEIDELIKAFNAEVLR